MNWIKKGLIKKVKINGFIIEKKVLLKDLNNSIKPVYNCECIK
jgi:hypothetical protein